MAFDPTKPVRTRDGRPARIICTDREGNGSRTGGNFPVIALVKDEGSLCETILSLTKEGRLYEEGEHGGDLVNIPEHMFTNLYRCCGAGPVHKTLEHAIVVAVKEIRVGWVGVLEQAMDGEFVAFHPATKEW